MFFSRVFPKSAIPAQTIGVKQKTTSSVNIASELTAPRTDLLIAGLQVGKVLVRERLLAAAAPPGVEGQHALQQVHRRLACNR